MASAASATLGLASDTPWSEKYRPKTLDEVSSHKDIIETGALRNDGESGKGRRGGRGPLRRLLRPCCVPTSADSRGGEEGARAERGE